MGAKVDLWILRSLYSHLKGTWRLGIAKTNSALRIGRWLT